VYLLVLVAGKTVTASWPRPASATRGAWWALKVATILAWQLAFLLANRRQALEGGNLRHLWGAANRLTLAQGVLLSIAAVWSLSVLEQWLTLRFLGLPFGLS
jgi:hypothetical protein